MQVMAFVYKKKQTSELDKATTRSKRIICIYDGISVNQLKTVVFTGLFYTPRYSYHYCVNVDVVTWLVILTGSGLEFISAKL